MSWWFCEVPGNKTRSRIRNVYPLLKTKEGLPISLHSISKPVEKEKCTILPLIKINWDFKEISMSGFKKYFAWKIDDIKILILIPFLIENQSYNRFFLYRCTSRSELQKTIDMAMM